MQFSSPPVISVIMAVYNSERFLRQAVDSILNQTFTDFEFLILDDGSTDRSPKILQDYASQDPRIVLTCRGNRGLTHSLNELICQARGEFIARMDGDDISLSDRLTHQVEFLRQHPDVVCVGGANDWIDEVGRLLITRIEPLEDSEIQACMLRGRTCINHPSALMRRSAVLQVGGYDEAFLSAQDLDLWLKLGEVGKLANLKEIVLQYRQHTHSISEYHQTKQIQNRQKACKLAWERRGIPGEFLTLSPWRPCDRPSRQQHFLRYGWGFFNTGQRWAAIIYGMRAVRALPWRIDGWKLLACALIKPLPEGGIS